MIRVAVVFLESRCNMKCTYCATDDRVKALTYPQAQEVLENVRHLGVTNLVLGGGEPLLWKPGVERLAKCAHSLGFTTVQLGTNCIGLTQRPSLLSVIDRFVVPLDSSHPDIHNRARTHRDDHFQIILKSLDFLRTARKSVTISTVVCQHTLNTLHGLADFLMEYQSSGGMIHAWHLYQFIPEGRGGAINQRGLEISEDQYYESALSIKNRRIPFQVYLRPNMFNSSTVGFFWYQDNRMRSMLPKSDNRTHE